jgi:hypothetical protein
VKDRGAVSAFPQERIAAERARDDSGTWLEHLTAALDYRAWHRFTLERWQDGRWRSAAGPASSGERVLTVTLPLFAAASAHYRSAQPREGIDAVHITRWEWDGRARTRVEPVRHAAVPTAEDGGGQRPPSPEALW